jgi:hypothetical protein
MNLIIFEKVWIEVERPSLSERTPYSNRSTGTQEGGQWRAKELMHDHFTSNHIQTKYNETKAGKYLTWLRFL